MQLHGKAANPGVEEGFCPKRVAFHIKVRPFRSVSLAVSVCTDGQRSMLRSHRSFTSTLWSHIALQSRYTGLDARIFLLCTVSNCQQLHIILFLIAYISVIRITGTYHLNSLLTHKLRLDGACCDTNSTTFRNNSINRPCPSHQRRGSWAIVIQNCACITHSHIAVRRVRYLRWDSDPGRGFTRRTRDCSFQGFPSSLAQGASLSLRLRAALQPNSTYRCLSLTLWAALQMNSTYRRFLNPTLGRDAWDCVQIYRCMYLRNVCEDMAKCSESQESTTYTTPWHSA